MAVTHTKRYVFQSVHTLNTLKEGKHGHHFYLELSYDAAPVELADQSFNNFIAAKLHAREIAIYPATGEKIVDWIHSELLKAPIAPHLRAVALQETDKNRYVSSRSEARFV